MENKSRYFIHPGMIDECNVITNISDRQHATIVCTIKIPKNLQNVSLKHQLNLGQKIAEKAIKLMKGDEDE